MPRWHPCSRGIFPGITAPAHCARTTRSSLEAVTTGRLLLPPPLFLRHGHSAFSAVISPQLRERAKFRDDFREAHKLAAFRAGGREFGATVVHSHHKRWRRLTLNIDIGQSKLPYPQQIQCRVSEQTRRHPNNARPLVAFTCPDSERSSAHRDASLKSSYLATNNTRC